MGNKDYKLELKSSIEDQIAKMRTRSDIEAMNYYYETAPHMYDIKSSDSSEPLVGILCNLVPEELILAAKAKPLRICSGFLGTISIAETILPQIYCPLVKSSVGFSMSGMFDRLSLIVVPTTCDGKKKVVDIFAEKKPTLIMEVPHTIVSPQARELWLKEIVQLKKRLAMHLGNKITRKELKRVIEKTNKKRKILRALYELRKQVPPISGSDALLVAHMSFYDNLDSWMEHTEKLINELRDKKPIYTKDTPRIMLTGSPMILPTWKIPLLIEEAGGAIVFDDLCSSAKTLLSTIEVRAWSMYDMLIGLADHYLMSACPCFVPNDPRMMKVLNYLDEYDVEGVVYHTLQGCQLYGGEVWKLEKAVRERGIPFLKLETGYGEGDIKQLKIRVDAFMEIVEAKKET